MTALLSTLTIPSPSRRGLEPRTRADPRLRPLHHRRHRRRDLDRRAALGGQRRPARRRAGRVGLGGPVRPGRRPALPRGHRLGEVLRRRQQPGDRALRLARRPRRVGRGGDGRARRPGGAPGSRGSRCCRSWTRWRPASWSPRRWAAGATGSTRSSTASRPTCPGGSRSIPAHRVDPATSTDATYHPTFLYECIWNLGAFGLVIWADQRFKLGLRPGDRALRDGLHGRPRLDRVPPRSTASSSTTSTGSGSTCGPRSCCSSPAAAYFVWSSRRHPGREEEVYQPGRGPERPTRARPVRLPGLMGPPASPIDPTDAESEDEPAEDAPPDR